MAFQWNILGGLFKTVGKAIDDIHTSDEERLTAQAALVQAEASVYAMVLDLEKATIQAQSQIITAEAQGDSWIQRSWRPITMLAMVATVMAHMFGLTPDGVPDEQVEGFMLLVQIGLGGYVAGRSGEKIVKNLRTPTLPAD
jgi:hypothetical protein